MKKIFLGILASILIYPQVFASPFDVLYSNVPDFTVNNIGQDTNSEYIYISICNKGGLMADSGDLTIGVKRNYTNSSSISVLIEGVRFNAGECNSYQVAKITDLGITTSGNYPLAGGVKLANYTRLESNSNNNILIKNVYVNSYNSMYNNNITPYDNNTLKYPTNYNDNTVYYNNTYHNNSYYNSNLSDLTVNDINYYEKTTVSDNGVSKDIYNSIVASVCNNGNVIYDVVSIRSRFEIAGRSDYAYINSNGYWNAGVCKKTWTSVDNFSVTYNSSVGVGVTLDDSNVVSELNEGNNYLYKSLYIPNYSNNNYSSNGYYCNNTWYNYSSSSNGYSCNGTWYNRNINDDYSQDTYFCNNTWYTYSYNATGYYCNNAWFNRSNYGNSSNPYYYCNNVKYNFPANSNGYYCNSTWYYRNYTDSDSSRRYFCNGQSLNSDFSDGYYCNTFWYPFYIYNNYNNSDIRIKKIFINNSSKKVFAEICNYGNSQINTSGKLTFYSSTTGKSRYVNFKINLDAGGCTDTKTYSTYGNLGIKSRGIYSITATLSPSNSSNIGNHSITNNIWIQY